MTAQNLTLIAAVAAKTSKLNFEAKQAEIDTDKIDALTGELNAALTALAGAKLTHAEAVARRSDAITANTGAAVAASLPQTVFGQTVFGQQPGAMAPGPGAMATGPGAMATGAMAVGPDTIPGGKSRSRKSHKKVSKSKRPKKSVHSRKAKGAKRSNKKH